MWQMCGVAGQVTVLTSLLLVVEIFHEKEEENSSPTPKLDARLSSGEQVWQVRPASLPEASAPSVQIASWVTNKHTGLTECPLKEHSKHSSQPLPDLLCEPCLGNTGVIRYPYTERPFMV